MSWLSRLALVVFGLELFAIGMVLTIRAEIGYGPWWMLHYGMTLHLPMTIGQASMLIGLLMVGLSLLLGVRPGLATPLNVLITGLTTDELLARGLVPRGSGGLESYLLMALGLVVAGLGTAIYVKGGLGAGPRDSFMLGLAGYLRGRVGLARNAMEVTVTLLGWLLGAPLGPGTLIFALGLGPCVGFFFGRLGVRVHRSGPDSQPARDGRPGRVQNSGAPPGASRS